MASRSVAFARGVAGVVSILILAALLGTALMARTIAIQPGLAAGSPTDLKSSAAAAFDAAHAKGGAGITFQIVQTATLHAKSGGPKINVSEPTSPGGIASADEFQVGSTIERGAYTPDGFWMEMREGPAKGANPDWDNATYEYGAIVKAGKTYRNDGQGWYETDQPPGIGLDPATVALLPRLLRGATNAVDAGTTPLGGVSVRKIAAGGKIADAPGIMAVDAKAFTALTEPMTFAFDSRGRLAQLRAVTRNTNQTQFDLLVDTIITFGYPPTPDPIPDPAPVWAPPAATAPKN